ncbi:MAG: beta-eliminating lyase-related protein [Candidatus Velthaea sp.]
MTAAARQRGAQVHLDGARLWECAPFYARPYADVAALFDSVYVSFYKGLGALAGAMLAGPAAFVAEARIWLRRHGGNLYTLFPYAFAAEQSFGRRIGRMGEYHRAALRVAAAFAAYPNVTLRPNPPVTNMFHAFLPGSPGAYVERAQRLARERGMLDNREARGHAAARGVALGNQLRRSDARVGRGAACRRP